MHKRFISIFAIGLGLALTVNNIAAEELFVDSFESGDKSATNSAGFSWSDTATSKVITAFQELDDSFTSENSLASSISQAVEGQHSLNLLYNPGKSWTEQRFDLGGSYPNIWFRYWIRVPTNYTHGARSPNNHKFFALYMDGYSQKGDGPTVLWEFWGDGSGGSEIKFHYSEGGYQSAGGHQQGRNFIDVPGDRGRWMEVVIHIKASDRGQSNGVIEFWRRWENESEFEKLHEKRNATLPIPAGGPGGWHKGYLMGWANAPYDENTAWLIDLFRVSTSSLLDTGNNRTPPSAPTTITIK